MVLETLDKGLKSCDKMFINPWSEGSSESRSSLSDSMTAKEQTFEEDKLNLDKQNSSDMTYPMPSMTDDSTLFHDSTIMTDSAFLSHQSSALNLRSFNSSPPQSSLYASPSDRTNSYQTSFQEKLQSPPL